jgi:small subunit ribosomal protein S16
MGRRHRPFFHICAMDQRMPRDGRVLEQLGTYDPGVSDVDARALLNGERVNYWLSVGAQPTAKAQVLIKKYGAGGTCVDAQKAALERLARPREIPAPEPPASLPTKPAKDKQAGQEPPAVPAEEKTAAAETAGTDTPPADQPPAETPDRGGSEAPTPEGAAD